MSAWAAKKLKPHQVKEQEKKRTDQNSLYVKAARMRKMTNQVVWQL